MDYKWNMRDMSGMRNTLCLNPCFNGLQMEHHRPDLCSHRKERLNPCFIGIQMEPMLKSTKV